MGAFNTHITKALAFILVFVLIAQGIATMTAAGKDKPPTQRDVVEFVVGTMLILGGMWLGLKTYDAL